MQPCCTLAVQSLVVTICTARLNMKKFHILPTACIYVFCTDPRAKIEIFPHALTGRFITRTEYVYCAGRSVSGPHRACYGTPLPLPYLFIYHDTILILTNDRVIRQHTGHLFNTFPNILKPCLFST